MKVDLVVKPLIQEFGFTVTHFGNIKNVIDNVAKENNINDKINYGAIVSSLVKRKILIKRARSIKLFATKRLMSLYYVRGK